MGIIKISYFYSNYLGGRFHSAGVTLFIQPASEFIFISKVDWKNENHEKVIIQGIKDGLNDIGFDIKTGISVQLTEIVEHDVDSSAKCFYVASRIAIKTRKDITELRKKAPNTM